MAHSGASTPPSISLDELIALNDEIVALVKSGVPLEGALSKMGEDLPGRLGRITQMLAERMRRGESLAEILQNEPDRFPPVYRAVVLAGLRGGRLAAALESVSQSARRLAETRRIVLAAFLYPILVVLVAWCLFVLFTIGPSRSLLLFLTDYDVPGRDLIYGLKRMGDSAAYWAPVVPAAILLLGAIWWLRSGRATMLQPRFSGGLLGWMPLLGRLLRSCRMVTFAEVLALLVENRVPLPDGIVLSAESTGDPRMIRAGYEIADSLRRGQALDAPPRFARAFPPLLDWLMVTGQRHGALPAALRHASEIYGRRARRESDVARLVLPILLTVAIGGTATLAYAFVLFVPWVQVLRIVSSGV